MSPLELPADPSESVLVYRDRIVPRSEIHFLRRQYIGFRHLVPVWVCRRVDEGLEELGAEPLILGRSGPLGVLDRVLYKQFGIVPPRPDLRSFRPRVVHAHFGRGGALALPIARELGIPLVVTFHGGDATKEKHYRRSLLPTVYQRRLEAMQREASAIICVSDYIRSRLIARGFPESKLRVIRYGVETSDPEGPPPPAKEPYVLFVGRFVEKKGIRHLIEAMKMLQHRGITLPLVLIGDGPLAGKLKEEARALEDVTFLGWLTNSEVRRWMRGAFVVCVPSITAPSGDAEGLPNVAIEAMAERVPVIGSHNSGIVEALEHGRTGLLVPPGDAVAIADAISMLARDPGLRHALGEGAQRKASDCFSAVAQSRLLESVLLSSVRSPGFRPEVQPGGFASGPR